MHIEKSPLDDVVGHDQVLKRYPHSILGITLSSTILFLAILAISALFQDSLATALAIFLPICIALGVATILWKLPRLLNASKELISQGMSAVDTASRRKLLIQSLFLTVGVGLYIFLPFLLAGTVPPILWISPLLGVIGGTNLGEILLTACTRVWERKHGGELFLCYAYGTDPRGKAQIRRISLLLQQRPK